MESPRLPPLVFKLNSHKPERICYGIDVVRCRKNALAHSKFPAPIFCPKDNMEQAREGHRELFLDAAGGMHWDHIYVGAVGPCTTS